MLELIRKTFANAFQIGLAGPNLEDDSGDLKVTNGSGTLKKVRCADPAGSTDAVTKGYADSNYGAPAGVIREIGFDFGHADATPTGTATVDSTATLPVGAVVQSVDVKITSGFNGGVQLKIGRSADDDEYAIIDAAQTAVANSYSVNLRSEPISGSAQAVRLSMVSSGTPSAGAGRAYITYSVPQE
jgi:hypothetical protein